MKKRFIVAILVAKFVVSSLYISIANRYPITGNEGFIFPERVYEVYGVNSIEANGSNSIKFITVNYDGETQKHLSRAYSPVTALIDSGYSISNKNKITSTSPIAELLNNSYILVETYRTTIDEILIELPYERIMKGNILCKKLATEVKEQEGV